jgi:hypothetical protein
VKGREADLEIDPTRLQKILGKDLEAAKPMRPDVRAAYACIFRSTIVLADKELDLQIRLCYRAMIGALTRDGVSRVPLVKAIGHFRKTRFRL